MRTVYLASRSAPPQDLSAPPRDLSAPPQEEISSTFIIEIPEEIRVSVEGLGKRNMDKDQVKEIVIKLCQWRALSAADIAHILGKSEKYVLREYISPLRNAHKITYTIPDMANHPNQAYKAE